MSVDQLSLKLKGKIEDTLAVMRAIEQTDGSFAWLSLATRIIILKEVLAEIDNIPFDPKEELWKLLND